MPAVNLSPIFNGWQAFTSAGLPLSGGLLNTYIAGGSTPQATYTTSAGSIANSNPIVFDAAGRPPSEIWLVSGVAYKFVLTDSLGLNPLTYDNIAGIGDIINLTVAGNTVLGGSGATLNVSNGAITVASGNTAIGGNLTVANNTTLGDASTDLLIVNPNAITWTNNPTHSGNHTWTGSQTVNGSATLGDASADAVTVNGTASFPLAVTTHTFGAKFGNVDRADSSTFDWYEEGTFTPTITFGGASVGVTYNSNRGGRFTRIGARVFFEVRMRLSSKGSSTGSVSIGGLPYPASSLSVIENPVVVGDYSGMATITGTIFGVTTTASTSIALFQPGAAASSALTDANFTNTTDLFIGGNYAA
jgi:hypothetical protein